MNRVTLQQANAELARAQKPGVGVPAYLRWVNRPLGGRVAVVTATIGGTPNGLTAISALLGCAGVAVLVLLHGYWSGPLAALLLLLGYVFDSADGQLARLQSRGGPAGEWLDHVVDGIRGPSVHIAVAVHLFISGRNNWLTLASLAFSVLVSGWFLSQLLAEKLLSKRPAESRQSRGVAESFAKQPQDASTTYAVIATIGFTQVFTVFYLSLFAWLSLVFMLSLSRKYRQLQDR